MNYPRYPKHKPSGIEWLGEVPAHWTVAPLKSRLVRNDGGVWGQDFDDEGTIVLRSTEQTVSGGWHIEVPARRLLTATELAAGLLKDGDLVVTKSSGSSLHIGKTSLVTPEIAEMHCCFSNFMQRLRMRHDTSPRFVWYVLNSHVGRAQLDYQSNTTTGLANLSRGVIGALQAAWPVRKEQDAIVAFLDRETARIDALIARKQRLIELLAEKRTALISQAVTKGLNPDAPMKDSGVEWLGEIPAHWEVKPLKRGVEFIEGPGILAVDFTLEGIPLLRIAGIGGHKAGLEGCNYLAPDVVKQKWEHFRVRCGDLLISGSASTGFCSEVDEITEGAVPYTGIIIVRPSRNETTKNFIRWFCVSGQFMTQALLAKTGTTIQHFGPSHLSRMTVAAPPLAEQCAIAEHLDRETSKLDALRIKVDSAIEKLKEYRAALIADAITGKIDVRSLAEEREVA